MRHGHALASVLALAACSPAELPDAADNVTSAADQAALFTASVVVPPGPVTVPLRPSALSLLLPSQILCDSYQVTGDDGDGDYSCSGTVAEQCTLVANSFYRELQVQLLAQANPATLSYGLESMNASTTFLYPDGSYTQGATAYKAARPALFDAHAVTGIQNKFIFKPINKDTLVLIGDPDYTMSGGAPAVKSVQYHVYTRSHRSELLCRSLVTPLGHVCWTEAAGQFAYERPWGDSVPHAVSTTRQQIPVATAYPTTLEPSRILCDSSFRSRPGATQTCEQAAREFYKEIEFQTIALTNPDTATSGLAALTEATTFVYPTGLVTEGLTALGANLGNLFGADSAPVNIQNKFLYKPVDADTVLFIGAPMFTLQNYVTSTTRQVESVQVSVYRRNATPLGNCRSATNVNGDVCWTELAEQWVYGQPLLGE